MPGPHAAEKMYGVPKREISGWWNALSYSTKQSYKPELKRLGMSPKDEYEVCTYFFGNLWPATMRAIARLYVEKHGGN